ncbi:hypothetical protein DSECCO2_553970 [anaerobic digester metagenome]
MEPAHPEGEGGHVEPGTGVVRVLAERHELVPGEIERRAVTTEVLRHHLLGKDVVSRRNRGMGGEDRGAPDLVERIFGRHTGNKPFPEPLEDGERRVALV